MARKTRPNAFGLYIIRMGERERIGAHHPLNDKTLSLRERFPRSAILPNRVLSRRDSGESRYVPRSNIRLRRPSTHADQPGGSSVVVSY